MRFLLEEGGMCVVRASKQMRAGFVHPPPHILAGTVQVFLLSPVQQATPPSSYYTKRRVTNSDLNVNFDLNAIRHTYIQERYTYMILQLTAQHAHEWGMLNHDHFPLLWPT